VFEKVIFACLGRASFDCLRRMVAKQLEE